MGYVQNRRQGTVAAVGVVAHDPVAPDYTRGEETISAWMGIDGFNKLTAQVVDNDPGGTAYAGSVEIEACNGDPTVATHWVSLGTITNAGKLDLIDLAYSFFRPRCATLTTGTGTLYINLEA